MELDEKSESFLFIVTLRILSVGIPDCVFSRQRASGYQRERDKRVDTHDVKYVCNCEGSAYTPTSLKARLTSHLPLAR